jgi:hypothetical protein
VSVEQVGRLFAEYIPLDDRTIAVAAYCIGMALFTIIMGNAFAAFPGDDGSGRIADSSCMRWVAIRRACLRNRHARRLLRHADDADGGELQRRAGEPA